MQTLDYSRISSLTSACDDAIHQAEHVTHRTVGNVHECARGVIQEVTEFLESKIAVDLRRAYPDSMRILVQRRDRLDMLLSRGTHKSARSRRITNGKALRGSCGLG